MKKTLILLSLLYLAGSGVAQFPDTGFGYWTGNENRLVGGIGFTTIDDQSYFSFCLRPEVSFGPVGFGLNINLLYDAESGSLRAKDWDSGYDYFRLLRYFRYGRKTDRFYTRIGTLDAARIGHGFIINHFTNEINYDDRKIGMEFDLDLGHFGFESMASNMGRSELFGFRGYYRPLYILEVPVLKNFAVGASFARDLDPDAWVASNDGVSVYGVDVELPLIKTRVFNTLLYADYAIIHGYSSRENVHRDFGAGSAVGVSVGFAHLLGLMEVQARLERRWLGEEFIPSFFDPFYEIQKLQISHGKKFYKTDMLIGLEGTHGTFGELYGNVLGNRVRLLGTVSKLDDEKSGQLHLAADASEALPTIAAHASYDKLGIIQAEDVFTLDDRSVARLGLGYKLKPYLILYVDYIWSFVETDPGSKIYKSQERIEPRLAFVYRFK